MDETRASKLKLIKEETGFLYGLGNIEWNTRGFGVWFTNFELSSSQNCLISYFKSKNLFNFKEKIIFKSKNR